ncbi:uncharacterized protein EAF01_005940 [Botrytis porri]|uniref:Uncharacterized protein n=1 Tax=Botrytis porri TaxID=87229 RepID=A0A4Z1KQ91_9HELO|nr:uncharacterized protein EAF01_005940 [Botrytis porri]KAF7905419.1 hypothetical protein EAF01_005940 [Botrytis porri]TGO87778.1 hypothetical protein BPOR_0204g00070 [Botrytis porri]
MGQFFAKMVLVLLGVGCALKWEERRNDRLANEAYNYEIGRLESGSASLGGGDGHREGGSAAGEKNESATAAGAGGFLGGENSGDVGLTRTLPLED